jgi:hypothetical protein
MAESEPVKSTAAQPEETKLAETKPEGQLATDASSQWQESGKLLAKWQERARTNQLQHYAAAQYFGNAHNAIGIPAVILSTVVGTTVFAALQKQVNLGGQIGVGAISVLAAVLAALQTFLRYSERAEKHRAAAAAYAAVRHRLEATTNTPVAVRGPLKEFLDDIEGQLDSLAQSAPNVPERVWKGIQAARAAPHFRLESEEHQEPYRP